MPVRSKINKPRSNGDTRTVTGTRVGRFVCSFNRCYVEGAMSRCDLDLWEKEGARIEKHSQVIIYGREKRFPRAAKNKSS